MKISRRGLFGLSIAAPLAAAGVAGEPRGKPAVQPHSVALSVPSDGKLVYVGLHGRQRDGSLYFTPIGERQRAVIVAGMTRVTVQFPYHYGRPYTVHGFELFDADGGLLVRGHADHDAVVIQGQAPAVTISLEA